MKKSLIVACVVIAVVIAGGSYVLVRHSSNRAKPAAVPQKQSAPKQTAQQVAQENQTAQNVPVSDDLSVSNIQESQAGGNVMASALVKGIKSDSGSCVFTFENDLAKPVVRQVNPSGQDSSRSCATGDIPEVEFSVVGTWKLTVRYFENNLQAVSTTSINIK